MLTRMCAARPRLPMVHQNSLRFFNDIAYESYGGLVLDDQEGARLAREYCLFWLHA